MNLEQSFMPYLIAFGWVAGLLVLGTFLRAKVKLFQKFLVPSSLIGGLIGFILISAGWVGIPGMGNAWIAVPHHVFSLIAFHLFSFSFIAIGLIGGAGTSGANKKELFQGSLWMWSFFAAFLCIQSLIGWGIFTGYDRISGSGFYAPLGFLSGIGFAQGPGQVLAISGVWQSAFKVQDALSVGITFAALGFFVAAFVGVPLAYWGIKKGMAAENIDGLSRDFIVGLVPPDSRHSLGRHTTHPGNIDSVAFHLAIMGFTYLLAYYFCYLLKYAILPKTLGPLSFGFIFFWGMIVAIFVRIFINKSGIGKYVDDDTVRRLTGTMVDFLVVSVLMAVKFTVVWKYIVPIGLIVVVISAVTLFCLLHFGRRLAKFSLERIVVMFGMVTGTVPSGLLLLRIVDPDFKSPAAVEVGLMNIFGLVLGLHLMFFIALVPGPKFPNAVQMTLVYAVTAAIHLVLLKAMEIGLRKSAANSSGST